MTDVTEDCDQARAELSAADEQMLRKLAEGPDAGGRRAARAARNAAGSELNPTEVREWAKAQGTEVKTRGRTPAELGQVQGGHQQVGSEHSGSPGLRRFHSRAE